MKLPVYFQRVESAAILFAAIFLYVHLHFNILVFLLFLLLPDITMVGYFKNPKIGAIIYNFGHSYLIPVLVSITGIITYRHLLIMYSLIWISHIAMDRIFGYGLKYEDSFNNTHLGHIGGKSRS